MSDYADVGEHAIHQEPPEITIDTGKCRVVIKPDGTVHYGEGYEPDAVARAFWEVLGAFMPCASCGGHRRGGGA